MHAVFGMSEPFTVPMSDDPELVARVLLDGSASESG